VGVILLLFMFILVVGLWVLFCYILLLKLNNVMINYKSVIIMIYTYYKIVWHIGVFWRFCGGWCGGAVIVIFVVVVWWIKIMLLEAWCFGVLLFKLLCWRLCNGGCVVVMLVFKYK